MATITKTERVSKKSKKKQVVLHEPTAKLTWKQYLKQLRKDIFECAFDPDICEFATITDLAYAAGLSVSTVHKLYRGHTFEPRGSTLFKLCKAIQMDVALVQQGFAEATPE